MKLRDLVRCPRCSGSLDDTPTFFECGKCETRYRSVGGIPVLVNEPEALVAAWGRLVEVFDRDMRVGLDELLAQTTTFELLPRTRARLEALHEHLGHHRARLVDVLESAGVERASPSAHAAADARLLLPSLLEYYVQIHRDWGWRESDPNEAREAADSVSSAIGDRPLGKFIVLGAGACGLAEELHYRHSAEVTLALDIDPLPFVVARKILHGETVSLYEFPPWPLDSTTPFAKRALRSVRAQNGAPIHLVFADAVDPPVPSESFDSMLTPWFIDQVPENMERWLERIRDLLRVGGRFYNFGPLLFRHEHTTLPHRYCVDEVLELVERAGFSIERYDFRRMTYLQSPIGCQGRTEMVLTFSAEKLSAVPARAGEPTPAWLSDDDAPVPYFSGLAGYQAEHPMFEAIAKLIDGSRTSSEIATELVNRHGLPPEAALPAVRACLGALLRKLGA
jgi:hypothetical protein